MKVKIFIMYDDDDIVSLAVTEKIGLQRVEPAGIIVLESRTGRGIGGRLLEAVKGSYRELGYDTIVVKTEYQNNSARRFYDKNGFRNTETVNESVDWKIVCLVVYETNIM